MKLIPDDPQMLADFADALAMLQGRKLEGRPEALIQQALKMVLGCLRLECLRLHLNQVPAAGVHGI